VPATDRLIALFGERGKMIRHHLSRVFVRWRIFNGLFVSSVLFKDIKNDCFCDVCA